MTSRKEETGSDMHTIGGRRISFTGERNEYDIYDIAHALSNQCRFNGHVPQHYSVAEHCVLMARHLLPLGNNVAFEALLHDASEAYVGDVVSPLKALIRDFNLIEGRIALGIMETFGVKVDHINYPSVGALYVQSDPVYSLDKKMAQHEAGSMGMRFGNVDPDLPPLRHWSPEQARKEYLAMFERLSTEL